MSSAARRPVYLFESVACNRLEGLLHVNGLLGAGFKVGDVVLALTPSLSALGCYLKRTTGVPFRDEDIFKLP